MKCAYRKYYIVCIITVSHSEFCADIAQNILNELSRLSKRTVNGLATNYTYKDLEGNQTTTLVESINTGGISYVYDYDEVNNIKSVTVGNKKTTYEYDELNQLTRVNDPFENVTHVYTYNNGNIVCDLVYEYSVGVLPSYPLSTTQYLYENATWSDILTGVRKSHFDNGVEIIDDRYSISSDTIGNITNLNGSEYSWLGRQLQSVSNSDNSKTTYSYNADGQRIAKAVNSANGDEYNYRYYYNGDILAGYKLVITKSDGSSTTHNVAFMYDENGEAFGFNYNGNDYYYVRNAQNDVIFISNSDNTGVVMYQYDAWGNMTACYDTSDDGMLSIINPYTYRGYYYEFETNTYFLKSRYYNPELCRFISADSLLDNREINHLNQFAYCANNPIAFVDNTGKLLIGCIVSTVVGAALGALTAAATGKSVVSGAISGAFVGGVSGLICGGIVSTLGMGAAALAACTAANIAIASVGNVMNQYGNYHHEKKKSRMKGTSNNSKGGNRGVKRVKNTASSFKTELKDFTKTINYKSVGESAVAAAAFTPLSFVGGNIVESCFQTGGKTVFSEIIVEFTINGNLSSVESVIELFSEVE